MWRQDTHFSIRDMVVIVGSLAAVFAGSLALPMGTYYYEQRKWALLKARECRPVEAEGHSEQDEVTLPVANETTSACAPKEEDTGDKHTDATIMGLPESGSAVLGLLTLEASTRDAADAEADIQLDHPDQHAGTQVLASELPIVLHLAAVSGDDIMAGDANTTDLPNPESVQLGNWYDEILCFVHRRIPPVSFWTNRIQRLVVYLTDTIYDSMGDLLDMRYCHGSTDMEDDETLN